MMVGWERPWKESIQPGRSVILRGKKMKNSLCFSLSAASIKVRKATTKKVPRQNWWSRTLASSTTPMPCRATHSCGSTAFSTVLLQEKMCTDRPILGMKKLLKKGGWLFPPQTARLSIITILWQWRESQLARDLHNKQTQHCLAWTNNLQFPLEPSFPPKRWWIFSVSSAPSYSAGCGVFFFLGCIAICCWNRVFCKV